MSRTVRPEGAEGTPSTARSGGKFGIPLIQRMNPWLYSLPFQGTTPKAYCQPLFPPTNGETDCLPRLRGTAGVERNSPAPQPLIGEVERERQARVPVSCDQLQSQREKTLKRPLTFRHLRNLKPVLHTDARVLREALRASA
jgi:hypothetical protein